MKKPLQPDLHSVAGAPRTSAALEVAFETSGGRELLTLTPWLDTLAGSVDRILRGKCLALHAFSFLPDQVRLLIETPKPDDRLPWMLFAMKRAVTQTIRSDLRATRSKLVRELTVRQSPGRYSFQVWEPGPGELTGLASATDVLAAVDSIHNAPVARGLCDTPADWPWSSWRSYNTPETAPSVPGVAPWRQTSRSEPLVRQEVIAT